MYVAQAGERTIHTSASALPLTTADEVSAVEGVRSVAPIFYTATLAKIRGYGVLKALGARSAWLYRLVFEQALVSVALGAAAVVPA